MNKKGNRVFRTLKYYYLKFKRLNGNPRALAGGTAIGVFVGLTPTVPLHTPLIILLTLATKTSVVAAILVSWVVFNPLTLFPIYYVSVLIGNYLTPYEINFARLRGILDTVNSDENFFSILHRLLNLGYETIVVLFVGGFVFSLPFALISYYCALTFFTYRESKKTLS